MTLSDFRHVRARIQPHIRITPLVPCDIANVYLKLENMQHTHSFKLRGAFSAILEFVATGDKRTVLTVSAGNHGQAIARAASTFNLPCLVVVPKTAPTAKIQALKQYGRYGVELRLEGENYDEAEAWTLEQAENTKDYAFISPYNNRVVILGQGTVAFEIIEQLPDVTAIVVPIGGGGLAAGVGAAIKQLRPSVRVVGVQTEASAAMYHSLKAGHMVRVPDLASVADGIAGNIDLNTMTFGLIQKYLDDVVLVSENEIKTALNRLLYEEKILSEGAGAAGFAAVMTGKVKASGAVAAVITGGNVDRSLLANL